MSYAYDDQNIFAKILRGEIPCNTVLETEHALAFHDINPQAPIHILVIPKQHIATVNDFTDQEQELLGKLFLTAGKLARDMGVADDGYRLNLNCNHYGGQTVFHTHVHLLAGRRFSWPPG